jgi:hypothetical protein
VLLVQNAGAPNSDGSGVERGLCKSKGLGRWNREAATPWISDGERTRRQGTHRAGSPKHQELLRDILRNALREPMEENLLPQFGTVYSAAAPGSIRDFYSVDRIARGHSDQRPAVSRKRLRSLGQRIVILARRTPLGEGPAVAGNGNLRH